MALFDAFHNEKLFPVNMTGPDSFELDGQEYQGKPQSAGREFAPGEKAHVAFTANTNPFGGPVGRRMPVIFAGATRRSWMVEGPSPFIVDVAAWLQSNAGPAQNAVGGRVDAALLDPRNSTTNWHLPTSTTTGVEHAGLRAFGLARVEVPNRNWEWGDLDESGGKTDVYMTAYPKDNEAGGFGVWVGAWRVSDRVMLWEASSGSGSGWTNPDYPVQSRFFVDALTGWGHAVERTNSTSPQKINSACASNKFNGSDLSRAASGGLNLANISLHSFLVTTGEGEEATTEIESYFFCPAHPAISTGGLASVDFLKMNQGNGHWDSHSSYDPALIPVGGSSEIPDLLAYGSETGGPNAWRGTEALVFVSGGVKEIFGGSTWSRAHWTLRSLKVDGTPGDLVVSKTIDAVNNPPVLSQGSLKTQIAGVDHVLRWEDSFPYSIGFWLGGLRIDNSTSDASWQVFKDSPPILLPYTTPNTGRLGTLTSRLSSAWPPTKKNCGGGISVDKDSEGGEHIAFCVMEPEQFLYAKGYAPTPVPSYEDPNLEDVTDELQTYKYRYDEFNACTGFNILDANGYRTDTIVPHGTSPSVTPGGFYEEYTSCVDIGFPEMTSSYRHRVYQVVDEGMHKQIYNSWIQQVGATYRTKLVIVAPDGSKRETDISQLLDATHSATARTGAPNYAGGGGGVTITGTESDFPAPSNVWQILLYIKKGLALVLRDLHADGVDNNPTPHLECWDISGDDFVKLSTVRLGSFSEIMTVDNNPQGWRAGDQFWYPYAFGPPRMKGCLDASGNPQILVMVGESKKVTSSQSGFKRVCYARINLSDPSAPDVLRHSITSPDEGVGNSGDVPSDWPLWGEMDSLILTPGHVTWIKDSKFRESIA